MSMPAQRILLAIALLLFGLPVVAQNEDDALRYSSFLPGGTARSWAMGGAIGAVGADPGSASSNPAGFGLYNTSEVSFTPQFEVNSARSTFYGTDASDTDNRFSFNNFALILSNPYPNGKEWHSGTFGISFDRQASYHWNEQAIGRAVPSTILQQFVNEANGTSPDQLATQFPFSSDLAYMTYGIDPLDTNANTYVGAVPLGSAMDQDHRTSAAGRLNTTSFFYAANYQDRFYLGASLGLASVRYERQTAHEETVLDTAHDLKGLSYSEQLLTTGNGVDLKLGMIGRVGEHLRLGAAFHSPKWLLLSDAYSYGMSTDFRTPDANGDTHYGMNSPDGSYSYRVRTPWSVLASVAYIVGQHGLVSVDYSYTDFRQARLNNSSTLVDDYDFQMENQAVRTDFRGTHSLRAGTEWRAGAWYFRGGWGIWPDAYAGGDARTGTDYMRFTSGIGYRTKHLSIDLTGIYGTRDTKYFPYAPGLVDPVESRLTDTRGMLTVAFRP